MDYDQGLRHITSGITWAASRDYYSLVVSRIANDDVNDDVN